MKSPIVAMAHSMGPNPEEEALEKITTYARKNGLIPPFVRLFGRNIYQTDKPEPHGYEYYLVVENNAELKGDIEGKAVFDGTYASLTVKSLFSLGEGWQKLFSWVESNGKKSVGVVKGEYGWVNSAFEELVDWQQQKPPTEWVFNLWVQLKE